MVALTLFTPAEAAQISGVNTTLQRDWRRREILPKVDGRAKFSSFDVAELLALNALAERVGPQEAKSVSKGCAAGILYSALTSYGVEGRERGWSGDFDKAAQAEVDAFEKETAKKLEPTLGQFPGPIVPPEWLISCRASVLADRALKALGHGPGGASRAVFWWPDGSVQFCSSVSAALDQVDMWAEADKRFFGAVTFLDNEALGLILRRRAGRPLAHVEAADCEAA